MGTGETCNPVKANPVVLWSNVAVVQPVVAWQLAQFAAAKSGPADGCGGAFVVCQVVKWHCEFPQSVAAMVKEKLLPMWQRLHATLACPLVSGKPNEAWLKVPAAQVVIGWQEVHCAAVVGKFAATWLGTAPPIVCVLTKAAW